MKQKIIFAAAIIAFLSFLSVPAFAEWFDGEAQTVDLKTQELTVAEVDPITEFEEAEVITIVPATTFAGVAALKDIHAGDEVTVEAKYDEPTDSWRAVSVEVAGAEE